MSTRSSISVSAAIVARGDSVDGPRAGAGAQRHRARASESARRRGRRKNGRIVGEGFHVYDNRDHAEIVALKQAGENARGATLYVTLEPCCTTGRTGPCTKAIIAAGVKRVSPRCRIRIPAVAGRGFAELKRAGIDVHVGIGRR